MQSLSAKNIKEGKTFIKKRKDDNKMPAISCEVKKCFYNKDGGCRLEGIKVEGANAVVSAETMYDSYTDASHEGCVNCACEDCACATAEIECSASNCRHNDSGRCEAQRIDVGNSSSASATETECRTFSEK